MRNLIIVTHIQLPPWINTYVTGPTKFNNLLNTPRERRPDILVAILT